MYLNADSLGGADSEVVNAAKVDAGAVSDDHSPSSYKPAASGSMNNAGVGLVSDEAGPGAAKERGAASYRLAASGDKSTTPVADKSAPLLKDLIAVRPEEERLATYPVLYLGTKYKYVLLDAGRKFKCEVLASFTQLSRGKNFTYKIGIEGDDLNAVRALVGKSLTDFFAIMNEQLPAPEAYDHEKGMDRKTGVDNLGCWERGVEVNGVVNHKYIGTALPSNLNVPPGTDITSAW